jgi:glycosyltransferase involved in cell wall biosynthesis
MNNNGKILLATGIFYPDVGGPAIHVVKIAERLSKEGFKPLVIAYGDDPKNRSFPFKVKRISRKYPKFLQWLLYFLTVFKETINSKIVYAFDPTAAGVPACIASRFWRKPFVIRIGGDPIWEREVEVGRRMMSITQYYEMGLYKQDKPILFKIIKTLLNNADKVVFYNQFWKDFANKYYKLPNSKIIIFKNPVFKRESANPVLKDNPTIIFAGRFVAYKNLPLVLNVFDKTREKLKKGNLLLIGKGPEINRLLEIKKSLSSGQHIEFLESLPQEKLFEKIRESSIAIGPALSEFNPNFILESLSFGKPVLLSKGHGLSVDLPEEFLFNPLDAVELQKKIEYLFNPENYKKAVETINGIDMNQTWDKVTNSHLSLIRESIK